MFRRAAKERKSGNRMIDKAAFPTVSPLQSGRVSIQSPELLQVQNGARLSYGAHQLWYPSAMGRMGGCGPTAGSNLLWYLCATRPNECGRLFDGDCTKRTDMQRLMEAVWPYITPGFRGVNKASMLSSGVERFGEERGVYLRAQTLEIEPRGQTSEAAMRDFLCNAFSNNQPVAFLNLCNGALQNLDNWHWVTLTAVDDALQAEMYDQGTRQQIDLALWRSTTKNGGALVTAAPA